MTEDQCRDLIGRFPASASEGPTPRPRRRHRGSQRPGPRRIPVPRRTPPELGARPCRRDGLHRTRRTASTPFACRGSLLVCLRLHLGDQLLEVGPAAEGVEVRLFQFVGVAQTGADGDAEGSDGLVRERRRPRRSSRRTSRPRPARPAGPASATVQTRRQKLGPVGIWPTTRGPAAGRRRLRPAARRGPWPSRGTA